MLRQHSDGWRMIENWQENIDIEQHVVPVVGFDKNSAEFRNPASFWIISNSGVSEALLSLLSFRKLLPIDTKLWAEEMKMGFAINQSWFLCDCARVVHPSPRLLLPVFPSNSDRLEPCETSTAFKLASKLISSITFRLGYCVRSRRSKWN